MTYNGINTFLSQFNSNSYNRKQIGYDKKLIISIYEYLKSLDLSEETITILINNIAYLNENNIKVPLFLDILSRTLGFISSYELTEIIETVKQIHNMYFDESRDLSLETYLHETEDSRLRKLFLDRNNKYLEKDYNNLEQYINELKFAAAVELDTKEYKDFVSYINNYELYKDSYSPLIVFKSYIKIREHLNGTTKLFWDTLYGNEYIVAFNKHDLKITDIYKSNIKSVSTSKSTEEPIQLDIFTYEDYVQPKIIVPENIKIFQISSIYNEVNLPELDSEKDLLAYYKNILNNREVFILPKLKSKENRGLIVEVN